MNWIECDEEVYVSLEKVNYLRIVENYSYFGGVKSCFEVYAVFDKCHQIKMKRFDSIDESRDFLTGLIKGGPHAANPIQSRTKLCDSDQS